MIPVSIGTRALSRGGGESCIFHKPLALVARPATPTTDRWLTIRSESGFVAGNFPEARFWSVSGWPTILPVVGGTGAVGSVSSAV